MRLTAIIPMEINITLLVQIIIFLSLLAFLARFLFAPLMALFDERERRIVTFRAEAAQTEAQAQEIATKIESQLLAARHEGSQFLKDVRMKLSDEQKALLATEKKAAHDRIEQAKTELTQSQQETQKALMQNLNSLVNLVLQKVGTKNSVAGGRNHVEKMEFSDARH